MQFLTATALTFAIALGSPAEASDTKGVPTVKEAEAKQGTVLFTLLRKSKSRSATADPKTGIGIELPGATKE